MAEQNMTQLCCLLINRANITEQQKPRTDHPLETCSSTYQMTLSALQLFLLRRGKGAIIRKAPLNYSVLKNNNSFLYS